MFLFDDILLAPLKGVIWIAQKLDDMAQKELTDTDSIKEKLMTLQLKYELDEISEEEYNEEEKKLLMRFDMILKQKKEKENV